MLEPKKWEKSRLAILLHSDPDLDCIGSAFAIRDASVGEYKEIVIVGRPRYKYSWIVHEGDILEDIPDGWLGALYDIACVDIGSPERLSKLQRDMLKEAFVVYIYDHHVFNYKTWLEAVGNRKMALRWKVDHDKDSCCEHTWSKVLTEKGRKMLTSRTITALLAGIYAESNCFRDSRSETFKVVAELIEAGANMQDVVRNCNKTIATWTKLKYLAKVIGTETRVPEAGLIVMESKHNEYLVHNFNIRRHRPNKAPVYILAMLRRENIKVMAKMNAYVLLHNKQDGSKKPITLILELIRWSKARQEALEKIGFAVFKERQYRYYLDISELETREMGSKIAEALKTTETEDLEFI